MPTPSTKLNKADLIDRSAGSLKGVFVGDAKGLPVECMSPSEIRQRFGYVNQYVSNKYHKWPKVAKRAAGTISDDGQTTLAMMESLKRKRDFITGDIADAHVEALDGKWGIPVGWGGSTRRAITQHKKTIWKPPPVEAAGNGPMIKLAPLSIFCVFRAIGGPHGRFTNSLNASLLKKCRELTGMTHGDPRCVVAAYCQARMIIRALQDELPLYPLKVAQLFVNDAIYAESQLKESWKVSDREWPEDLVTKAIVPDVPVNEDGFDRLSDRMIDVFCGRFGQKDFYAFGCGFARRGYGLALDTRFVSAQICTEKSSFVMNSYPLVAYCVAKYLSSRDAMHIINETVNAGADADSNGSMVGAIVGACFGSKSIPEKEFSALRKHKMIARAVKEFLGAIAQG